MVTVAILLNKYGHKGIWIVAFLALAFAFSLILQYVHVSLGITYFLFALTGMFIGGPYNILPVLGANQIKSSKELIGNEKAASTVIAIVNASGNVGAAIFQQIIPFLGNYLLLGFAVLCLSGGISLLPIIVKDIRSKKEEKKEGASNYKQDSTAK